MKLHTMKFKHSLQLAIGILALALTLPASNAASVLTYTGGGAPGRIDGSFTVGSIFTVNTAGLSITQLGVMDASATGTATDGFITSPIDVGLWSYDGTTATLLTPGISVSSTDTLTNGYRYTTLAAPVSLTLGGQYIIGALVGAGHEYFLDGDDGAVTPISIVAGSADFTLNSSSFDSGGPFAAPTTIAGGPVGRWGPANATVVPEPSSVAMAVMGGVGMLGMLRRRRA